MTLFGAGDHPLLEKIRGVDVNTLTPLDALSLLKQWQDELTAEKPANPR